MQHSGLRTILPLVPRVRLHIPALFGPATAACEIEKGLLSHKVPLNLNHFGDDPVQRIHDHQRLNSVSERQEIAKAISTSDSTRYGE